MWGKDEGQNPTGSFKARGLGMALTKARTLGVKGLMIPSAGNAGGAAAVYGAPFDGPSRDDFHLTPLTSYGTQKAIGELLLADYTRRGFCDGVGLRLPAICVRPGKPNKAASGFFSGIIREPLAGQEAVGGEQRDGGAVDLDPDDVFRFDLSRYNAQLVAGYERTLVDGGLEVWMRDVDKLDAAGRTPAKPVLPQK